MSAIGDLDSDFKVQVDSFYHITTTFDGQWMAIYINGELNNYRQLTGHIRTTSLPFLMAQMLPDNTAFNFRGIIDEVKIFDFALTPETAATLYNESITAVRQLVDPQPTLTLSPNPVSDLLNIQIHEPNVEHGTLSVFNLNGLLVKALPTVSAANLQLTTGHWQPGIYIVIFKTDKIVVKARFVKL